MATVEDIFKQFLKKVDTLQQNDQNGQSGFAREFQMLRQTSAKYKGTNTYSTQSGECAFNKVKNRFKDILPFDSTRVTLPSTTAEGSDYINANLIKGVNDDAVYIASQGPLPNTVNDFWRMLWSYKVKVVVMLCREAENGKKKCQRYWCENNEEKMNFGGIQVKTKKCVAVGHNFTIRTLVAQKEGEELTLTQFHYTAWPDHGVPRTATPLLELIKLVRDYQQEDSAPIIFHCSAGCGRTGTICALDYTKELLKQGRAKEIDPYKIVGNLRKQRAAMVQTKGQYEFLCRAMCSLFRMHLNLPMQEAMENHVYENVTTCIGAVIDDTDCDRSPSAISPAALESSTNKSTKFAPLVPAEQPVAGRKRSPGAGPPTSTDKKRLGQCTQQSPSDSYVNVDLIDLSGNGDSQKPQLKTASRTPGNVPAVTALLSPKRSLKGKADGGVASPKMFFGSPVVKQSSSEEVSTRSRSPVDISDKSDYVVSPRGSQPKAQNYENVADSQLCSPNRSSPTTKDAPLAVSNGQQYENVEVKPPNSERKSTVPTRTRSQHENTAKKVSPKLSPKPNIDVFRAQIKDAVNPAITLAKPESRSCGPRSGVEKVKALNVLQRAKVLPSEETRQKSQLEDELEKKFLNDIDVNSGLYASVGSRHKAPNRKPLTDGIFSAEIDSVDDDRAREVPKKMNDLPIVLNNNQIQHDSGKLDNKSLSLARKIALLTKKPEMKDVPLDNIGFGVRLSKPKGPRKPPASWTVKD